MISNILMFIFITILLAICLEKLIIYWSNKIQVKEFDSNNPGPHVLIIGSTHGDEPAGYHACIKLIDYLSQHNLKQGKVTIIPKPNKLGLRFNSRYMLQNKQFKI